MSRAGFRAGDRERGRAVKTVAALLLALTAAAVGCRSNREGDWPGVVVSYEEIVARPPDAVRGGVRLWRTNWAGPLSFFYAQLPGGMPMGYNLWGPTAVVLVAGRAEVRVGHTVKVLGPGSYFNVPKRTTYGLRPIGDEEVVLAFSHAAFEKFAWTSLKAPLSVVR